jgi:KipI family sensor histidine kinase inhibitor
MEQDMAWSAAKIQPLGDGALLVRFGDSLGDAANRQAIALAQRLRADPVDHVVEVVSSLVSVLVRYDVMRAYPQRIAGEIGLRLAGLGEIHAGRTHTISVRFGGEDGPDLEAVAAALGLSAGDFVARHNAHPMRVLATGFAPGFVYCGFHAETLVLPRRTQVRKSVPAGSVLFAAGQTAIAATEIPTGWHVIGRTGLRNFDPERAEPTVLGAGDLLQFEALP